MSHPKRTRKELRGAIIGMVMGDSSLYQAGRDKETGMRRGNHTMSMSHSRLQREYLEHKMFILNDLFDYKLKLRDTVIKSKQNGKTYLAVRLYTKSHSRLSFIAKNIYINHKKRITEWVLDNITNEGLALWWMDDGCMHQNKAPKRGGSIIWGTYGFPKEDVELFQSWLSEKHGINMRIGLNKKSGGWYLRRGMSEGLKFNPIIREYAPPSMIYKFVDLSMFRKVPYNLSGKLDCSVRPLSNEGDEIVQAHRNM